MVLVNLSMPPPSTTPSTTSTETIPLLVPSHSNWFKFGEINDIEKKSLPEFFTETPNPQKSPEVYVGYRDYMISTYRNRPNEYLSITACRRFLTGDVGAIVRVHAFLEQWGLINFQVEKFSSNASASQKGVNYVVPAPTAAAAVASVTQTLMPSPSSPSALAISCQTCSANISGPYFMNTQTPYAACQNCYAVGNYPLEMNTNHFVRIDPSLEMNDWTEEEVLTLFEAIEEQSSANHLAPIDWSVVEARMRPYGKTREQCLWKFLKLPILDSLESEKLVEAARNLPQPVGGLPLFRAENPILGTLALLASLVHPKVAAAAAQAALESLAQNESSAEAIAATALGCATARAAALASEEEQKIKTLQDTLLSLVLAKLKLKVAFFEELEKSLDEERKEIEQLRLQLFMDRFNLKKLMLNLTNK